MRNLNTNRVVEQSNNTSKNNNQYLHKTINMKNQHINKLLEELKLTQELHSNLKKKYLMEEQKIKQKLINLQKIVQQLKSQNTQLLKKYQQIQTTYKYNENKNQKLSEYWQKQVKCLQETISRLKLQNSQLESQKKLLAEKLNLHFQEKLEEDEKIKEQNSKIKNLEEKISQISIKNIQKDQEIKKLSNELINTMKIIQNKNSERKKTALNQIENKILQIINNI